ncbi:MAG: sulfate adenylyltransferase [Candidatus Omnitrophica bacterium CG11_big_fil_rev_8_21_14_0_20_42_13]|uniref:Sulfate adenylyltransferase subunit 2 n=1 Tax=Candidatus Ghiorseimicrobium undicola TaxID=1974746 RepID=A0A2H0LXS5_9BACT|nr:MAG: sulfate adenylyltransferase [Candidatus Omnitrophica bacterium CG11_big_fil_rev_8_21_14_0_20_42_13]
MDRLSKLENDSIYIIREAYYQFKDTAALWSIGKDSTTLLWLIRKAFFGEIPFPVIHIDTTYKFKEIYEFREKYAKKWRLKLLVCKNQTALDNGVCPKNGKLNCCSELKTNTLKQAVKRCGLRALYLGIRRDEHGIRAKERFFSPRNKNFDWNYKSQPPELWNQYAAKAENEEHMRIHPLLSWNEIDVWRYIRREKIPVVRLYLASKGRRYRSIGCAPCCAPVKSGAGTIDKIIEELQKSKISERGGRAQDKESAYMMQKLRSLGYM